MTLAIIPARAGSKGIKGKNLANLNGKPLIYYTIKAAKESQHIDEIVVSSDGEDILEYAKSEGVTTLNRPHELALDDTTSDKVILHTLEHFSGFDRIILLQPTSPFRTAAHIDEAFRIYKTKNTDALISVTAIDNKILKAFIADENGFLRGISNNTFPFMPRQKLPKTFMGNGAIYIISRDLFIKTHSFLQEKTCFYEMSAEDSLDIDNPSDLDRANEIMATW